MSREAMKSVLLKLGIPLLLLALLVTWWLWPRNPTEKLTNEVLYKITASMQEAPPTLAEMEQLFGKHMSEYSFSTKKDSFDQLEGRFTLEAFHNPLLPKLKANGPPQFGLGYFGKPVLGHLSTGMPGKEDKNLHKEWENSPGPKIDFVWVGQHRVLFATFDKKEKLESFIVYPIVKSDPRSTH